MTIEIGDKVRAKVNMDEWTDCHGHSRCASKGDILIIRKVNGAGHYSVSHEDRVDGMTFYANSEEIEFVERPTNGN